MKMEIDGLSTEQINYVIDVFTDWVLKNEFFGNLEEGLDFHNEKWDKIELE